MRPLGIEGRLFVDALSRRGGRMYQVRAGKDKLLHLEILQQPQQALGTPHRDLFIEWTRRAGKIVIGGEVND